MAWRGEVIVHRGVDDEMWQAFLVNGRYDLEGWLTGEQDLLLTFVVLSLTQRPSLDSDTHHSTGSARES